MAKHKHNQGGCKFHLISVNSLSRFPSMLLDENFVAFKCQFTSWFTELKWQTCVEQDTHTQHTYPFPWPGFSVEDAKYVFGGHEAFLHIPQLEVI
jgi:hypothetical protein